MARGLRIVELCVNGRLHGRDMGITCPRIASSKSLSRVWHAEDSSLGVLSSPLTSSVCQRRFTTAVDGGRHRTVRPFWFEVRIATRNVIDWPFLPLYASSVPRLACRGWPRDFAAQLAADIAVEAQDAPLDSCGGSGSVPSRLIHCNAVRRDIVPDGRRHQVVGDLVVAQCLPRCLASASGRRERHKRYGREHRRVGAGAVHRSRHDRRT